MPAMLLNGTNARKGNQMNNPGKLEKMNDTPSQSPIAVKRNVRSKAASGSAGTKTRSRKKTALQPDADRVALRAYFIGERRRTLGIPGDATSDWLQAERELLEESKAA
jgi:hypothetical protein